MAGAFDDEMEGTMTIDEYIEDMEAQELEADLVLGGDEGKECTYSKGYMRRQALFSCLTCTPNGNAGVCTACCLSCHDGHEIIELWTKRNFRCDCGNSKFQEFSCKLYADKEPENTGNNYNQNFKGSYCTCFRPYPDPNAEEQVAMIQCCICEDWFHENHLGLEASEEIPRDEEGEPLYEDFICQNCAMTCSFLKLYPRTIWASATQSNSSTIHTKEENLSEHVSAASASSVNIQIDACSLQIPKPDPETSLSIQNAPLEEDTNKSSDVVCCHAAANSDTTCILGMDLSVASPVLEKKPMFLAKSWRDQLCRCKTCVGAYAQNGIGYLIDKEDSLEEYEKVAKLKREENLQKQEGVALNLFDNLDHVAKIEILSGIADMKNEIKSFLPIDTSATSSKICLSLRGGEPFLPHPMTNDESPSILKGPSKFWAKILLPVSSACASASFDELWPIGPEIASSVLPVESPNVPPIPDGPGLPIEDPSNPYMFALNFQKNVYLFTCEESHDTSNPITSADVHQVFENLAKKRQRLQ